VSTAGLGSTFTVTLPREPASVALAAAGAPATTADPVRRYARVPVRRGSG
jgi:hypothetical protein